MMAKKLLSILFVWGAASSAFSQAPKITGFSPANGPVNTAVTINGSGFSATTTNDIVYFGPVRGTVTAASATQLTVQAPAGAGYEPLSVTVNGKTDYAAKPFVITFPGSVKISQQAFKPYLSFSYLTSSFSIYDLDLDGKSDLLYSGYGGPISAVKNITGQALSETSFSDAVTVAGTVASYHAIAVDFDNDGFKDLLQPADDAAAGFQVYRNLNTPGVISAASFGPAISLPLLATTDDYTYADVDQDGLVDIVASVQDGNDFYITIYQNTSTAGSISFAARVDIANSVGGLSIAAGDLDEDGFPDLALGNADRTLSVFKNTMTAPGSITTGSFGAPIDLFSNDYAVYVKIADMDLDGKNDIVLASQTLVIHHNIGTPGTLTAASFDTPVELPTSGAFDIGDLNGDGRPDLAVTGGTYDALAVIINNTTPGNIATTSFSDLDRFVVGYNYFGVQSANPRIADLDNDGKSEILVINTKINNIAILRNSFGTPPSVPTITSITPISAEPGAGLSIAGTNFSTTAADNIVFFGATRAVVNTTSATTLSVTVPLGATLDYVSVAVNGRTAFSPKQFTPMQGGTLNDTISFLAPIDLGADGATDNIMLKDMDNDGRTDIIARIVLGSSNPQVNIYKNIGQDINAAFDDPTIINGAGFNYGIIDSDSDGNPDLIGGSYDGGDGSLFILSPGTGNITDYGKSQVITDGGIPDIGNFAIGDLDGDGQPDVGVKEAGGYSQIEYRRNFNGGFPYEGVESLQTEPSDAFFLVFADIDGDGKRDAVYCHPVEGTITVHQNISTKDSIIFDHLSDPVSFNTGFTPLMMLAVDLDGDGKIDIITVNSNSVSVLQNTTQTTGTISASSFATHFELDNPAPLWSAAGDLNGDGKIDLGFANADNTISIFRNISSPGSLSPSSFADKVVIPTPLQPSGLAFGDLNNDGATDMAVTIGGSSVFVYINSHGNAISGDGLIVYNGVSPNGDGKNDHWQIQNINTIADTKSNHVVIYDRWGDLVYEADNYDNTNVVFTGRKTNGNDLPNGTYFYRIKFNSSRKPATGFISLKK